MKYLGFGLAGKFGQRQRPVPLTLACLKQLIDALPEGMELEDTTEELAQMFAEYANDSEFEIDNDHTLAARRE